MSTLTKEQLQAAREWLADCQWEDIDAEEIQQLDAATITRAVRRHYHNGLSGFIADCAPVSVAA
jgi:hypothetical protein